LPLLILLGLAVGCTATQEGMLYTNDAYNYSVSYPSSWRVSSRTIAPPPPEGILFESDSLSIGIVVAEPGQSDVEQEKLRTEGWREETISVAGKTVRSFSRPESDKTPGLWRRVYFTHNGHEFQLSLNVYDADRAGVGLQVFQDMLQSLQLTDESARTG